METKNVYFFVFDGLVDYEASYALAAINNPDFQREPGRFKVQTVGVDRAPIVTMGGLRVTPDIILSDVSASRAALLVLPGGKKWEQGGNMEAIPVAHDVLSAGGKVAAICGATLGLAKAGLLNDRKHTSNAPEYLGQSGYKGASRYVDIDAITDGSVITAGAVSPTGFAREIAKALDLYAPGVRDAWYNLIETGDRKYFFELMSQAGPTPH